MIWGKMNPGGKMIRDMGKYHKSLNDFQGGGKMIKRGKMIQDMGKQCKLLNNFIYFTLVQKETRKY